jgi:hypothetical protein
MTEQTEDKYRDLIEQRHQIEDLLEHPAWATVIRVLQEQADLLQSEVVFTPLVSADRIYQQEFQKGKLAGLVSVSRTVEGLLAELNMEIEDLNPENQNDAGNE